MTKIQPSVRRIAIAGAGLVLIGLLTGFISGLTANPRMGLSSHLAALSGGTLLLALAGIWTHVSLQPRGERWAIGLMIYAMAANWLATLLAAVWGAGAETMPLAAGGRQATALQEGIVTALLASLSVAAVVGVVLVLIGLVQRRSAD